MALLRVFRTPKHQRFEYKPRHWNPKKDVFCFDIDMASIKLPAKSPRELVAVQCSLFDPQGFYSPYSLLGRKMMQKATSEKKGWDSRLSPDLEAKFLTWSNDIPKLRMYKVPRWWNIESTRDATDISLHIFADAAQEGYGAVVYRRVKAKNGDIFNTIVTSRSHVVPKNAARAGHHNSIPRLELTAAAKAMELKLFVEASVGTFEKVHIWSDSECVLKMLNDSTTRFKQYFANRISKIEAASNISDWKYVNTSVNPADACSRGIRADEATKWRSFHEGPKFLWEDESAWPSDAPETPISTTKSCRISTRKKADPIPLSVIYNLALTVDSWHKKLRRVASFLRILGLWKKRTKMSAQQRLRPTHPKPEKPTLSLKDLGWQKAEKAILQAIQRHHFDDEILNLQEEGINSAVAKMELQQIDSKLRVLNPFVHTDGYLRVGSRITKAEVSEEGKAPLIMPRKDENVRSIIRYLHQKSLHAGPKFVLNDSRRSLWIIQGGQEVKSVLSKCIKCQRAFKKPIQNKMGILPEIRVTSGHPFSAVPVVAMLAITTSISAVP